MSISDERRKYFTQNIQSQDKPGKDMVLVMCGMDRGKPHLPHLVQKSKVCTITSVRLRVRALYTLLWLYVALTWLYDIFALLQLLLDFHFLQLEKGSNVFLPTHVTGVIAHGQDLKFCFVDELRWPADSNVTMNVAMTVVKYVNDKVIFHCNSISIS